jgi:hypothetical protein
MNTRRLLLLILLASLGLRLVLVLLGGQFYWPDEQRYNTSRRVAAYLMRGAFARGLRNLDDGEHVLFKAIAVAPATVEYFVYCERGTGDEECVLNAAMDAGRIPATFFALFSVASIALLGAVAVNLGAGTVEALAASALMALSASLFYWSRHLVPYDAAMALGLSALWLGTRGGRRPVSSLLCGALAGWTFLTYAGYWTLGGAAILIHLASANDLREAMRRTVLSGAGLVLSIGSVVLVSNAVGGGFTRGIVNISTTVVQGLFSEGWRLPFEYLWHTEHALLIIWVAAAVFWMARPREAWRNRRARAGMIGLAFILGSLVLNSVVFERFVVYGRLARQLVPFVVLVTAATVPMVESRLPAGSMHALRVATIGLLLAQAAWNFRDPLRQSFPREFLAGERLGPGIVAVYTHHIYPTPDPVALPDRYVIMKEARHPLQFLPYQYEGYTPAERHALRSTDIRMRLIRATP